MEPTRRGLILGAMSLLAAPAIVRVSSLMPVKVWSVEYPPAIAMLDGVFYRFGDRAIQKFVWDDDCQLYVQEIKPDDFYRLHPHRHP
jgi:hypothetical protein